jgi:ParB-like chromosome segregation protein Spo0J
VSIPFSPDQFVRGRPTKRLRVDDLQPTQVYVNPAKVASMAKKPGRDLPPIVASADNNVYDGHHRYGATLLRKRKTIDAVVFH